MRLAEEERMVTVREQMAGIAPFARWLGLPRWLAPAARVMLYGPTVEARMKGLGLVLQWARSHATMLASSNEKEVR